jgi:hypothetical protein
MAFADVGRRRLRSQISPAQASRSAQSARNAAGVATGKSYVRADAVVV